MTIFELTANRMLYRKLRKQNLMSSATSRGNSHGYSIEDGLCWFYHQLFALSYKQRFKLV